EVEFRSVFCASSRKFKILAIPNLLTNGKPYEYSFVNKHDDYKLCVKSHAKSSFDHFLYIVSKFKILTIPNVLAHGNTDKILVIPNVLAYVKSYKHGFMKKCDGHNLCVKLCAKSSFDRFFMHCLENSKY
ncbi:hypothetical protein B296_00003086, partial [Ensete ventricosum]